MTTPRRPRRPKTLKPNATFITPADLRAIPTEDAEIMIADAVAIAALHAPCIETDDFIFDEIKMAQLKAILRGAITRWHESGSGAVSTYNLTAGPYSGSQTFDTRSPRHGMFSAPEIGQLRTLCPGSGGAFIVDMTGEHGWNGNPLYGAVVNYNGPPGGEPWGHWA